MLAYKLLVRWYVIVHHLVLEEDLTRGLMPSLYRLLVLLKLTRLKITRWPDSTFCTVK